MSLPVIDVVHYHVPRLRNHGGDVLYCWRRHNHGADDQKALDADEVTWVDLVYEHL